MAREDIEAGPAVCRSFNCSDVIGDLAAKVFREFDNLEVLVESKPPAQETEDQLASINNMQAEDCERGLLCPSFNSYSCSDKLADIAVKVIGEFDQLPPAERKSEEEEEDDDFTFAPVPKWAHKFYFGPVYPVFNRDLLIHDFSQGDLEASVEEKSKPMTTGTAPPARRLTLNELFKEVDGSRFVMPSSTSNSTRSSACCNWKLRDFFRRTNTESQTMSSSRSSKKKGQSRRSWIDRCLGDMRRLCFSLSYI